MYGTNNTLLYVFLNTQYMYCTILICRIRAIPCLLAQQFAVGLDGAFAVFQDTCIVPYLT